jgi:hypothetical protein
MKKFQIIKENDNFYGEKLKVCLHYKQIFKQKDEKKSGNFCIHHDLINK